MVRPAFVIEIVLNKLEPRQPHRVIRQVIGPTRIRHRDRRHGKVLQRRNPLPEDRLLRRIPLQIHTTDPPAAVIHIEVRIQRLPLRLGRNRPRSLPIKLRQLHLVRIR